MRFMMLCSGLYEYRNMKWYTHVLSHLYLSIFQIIDILFIIYIFNILAKPQQRCSAKDFPRTLPRLACIRSTRIFTSNDQFQLSFLSYDYLTFQMRLLDLSLEILSLPEIPCLQIARYQGSRIITPRRGCFHKGSAHSPQGPEDEASKHVAFRRSKQWLQHFLTKQRHPKIFPIFCWSLKFHVNLISIFDKLLREIEHDVLPDL